MRVLVVDDDEMSRELLSVLLDGHGYAVDTAESGEAALERLCSPAALPDVILSDMQMPGVSGPELAAKLRAEIDGRSVLLAMSGSQPPQDAVSQFDGFLLKPFKVEQFTAAVERVQRQRAHPPQRRASGPGKVVSIDQGASPAAKQADGNASEAVPVMNDNIYEQLTRTMPSPQLKEMYTLCINDARERIRRMRGSAAEHDSARFVREAHAIKGSAGMLGATQIHVVASDLETRGLEGAGGTKDAVNSLDELAAACDRLERMLGTRA
ncbi:MAG TPA: response regulator [Acidobacteriaceae bacterium]|nr:response regulator [Acidobacteriaceae bacterium]